MFIDKQLKIVSEYTILFEEHLLKSMVPSCFRILQNNLGGKKNKGKIKMTFETNCVAIVLLGFHKHITSLIMPCFFFYYFFLKLIYCIDI